MIIIRILQKALNYGLILIILISLAHNAQAMRDTYPELGCELIAQDWQSEHSGNLVYVQRLTASGAYDMEKINHWMNRYYDGKKVVFYDYASNQTYQNKSDVEEAYAGYWNISHTQVFIVGIDEIPFPIVHMSFP